MMKNYYEIVSKVALVVSLFSFADGRHRFRRQAPLEEEQPEVFNLPYYSPLPGRSLVDLSPLFPFTGHGSGALEVEPGDDTLIRGQLQIPIPGWGVWDFNGGLLRAPSPFQAAGGVITRPLNPLRLNPSAVSTLLNSPLYRRDTMSLPVAALPPNDGSFVPLRCRPPLCNPFVHSIAVGAEVGEVDESEFGGQLDFPIPLGPSGLGIRFPLNGEFEVGGENPSVSYAHHLGPVNLFDIK